MPVSLTSRGQLIAPPGTPADQVQKLNPDLREILAAPEVRTAFSDHCKQVAGFALEKK